MTPVSRPLKPGVFAPILTFFSPETEDVGARSYMMCYEVLLSSYSFLARRLANYREACTSRRQSRRVSIAGRLKRRGNTSNARRALCNHQDCPPCFRCGRTRDCTHHRGHRHRVYSRDHRALQGGSRSWRRLCYHYHQRLLCRRSCDSHKSLESLLARSLREESYPSSSVQL